MADINRDDDLIEVAYAPRFGYGERVVARSVVRNDGTYSGKDIGEVLVHKGEIGYVTRIDTFLQQFYIYAVDFADSGRRVGMRAKELCTLDKLPDEVMARLGDRAGDLQALGRSRPAASRGGTMNNTFAQPRAALYAWGLRVVALDDLINDGSYPGLPEGALLAGRGTLGEIVKVGHATQQNEPVYLVAFGAAVVGCYEEEIAPAPAGLLPPGGEGA